MPLLAVSAAFAPGLFVRSRGVGVVADGLDVSAKRADLRVHPIRNPFRDAKEPAAGQFMAGRFRKDPVEHGRGLLKG